MPPSLLLVAHGSRDPRAARALDALVEQVRRGGDVEVRLAWIDHTEPSVGQALEAAADDGDVVVLPLLLSAAAHSKGDIPGSIQVARRRHPARSISYGVVLGAHPLLLAALERRLREAGVPEDAALVLAATGSADPEANAEIARVARLLYERRGGAPVEVGFASATTPTVAQALARLDRPDAAVAAYFLAPGRLLDVVGRQAAGHTVTAALAGAPELATLVLERYAQARAGRAAMNCDCCVYRSAWPGHEARVGALQGPHAHPAEVRP